MQIYYHFRSRPPCTGRRSGRKAGGHLCPFAIRIICSLRYIYYTMRNVCYQTFCYLRVIFYPLQSIPFLPRLGCHLDIVIWVQILRIAYQICTYMRENDADPKCRGEEMKQMGKIIYVQNLTSHFFARG